MRKKEIKKLDEVKKTEQVFSNVNLLNIDKDLIKTKVFKDKGKFTIELPNNLIKLEIGRKLASYFNTPLNNVLNGDLIMAKAIITLDEILSDYPDWWEGASRYYDSDFILELFNWYLEEEKILKGKLKKNKLGVVHKRQSE